MKQFRVESVIHSVNHVVVSLLPRSNRDWINFAPGQYATLSYQRTNGAWSPVRSLSFTNSPEGSGRLEFAFRITGNFTDGLSKLSAGDTVRIQGPFGEFVLPQSQAPTLMIAGGIGITPFLSMLRSLDEDDRRSYTLLYSCQQATDVPFLDEIKALTAKHSRFNAYVFLDSLPRDNHTFIQGPITKQYLAKVVGRHVANFNYYICGPEGMIRAMSRNLEQLGAYPSQILTESFSAGSKTSNKIFGFSPVQLSYAAGLAVFVALAGAISFKDIQHKVADQPAASQTIKTTPSSSLQPDTTSNSTSTDTQNSSASTPAITDTSGTNSAATTAPSTAGNSSSYTSTYQSPRSSVS